MMILLNYPFAPFLFHLLLSWNSLLGPCAAEEEYQRVALERHNHYRKIHQVGPLQMDDDLNARAVKCAGYYVDKKKIDHKCPYRKDGIQTGENLWMGGGTKWEALKVAESSTDAWYNEVENYDFEKGQAKPGKVFGNIGHFTQVVWKATTKLGIGFNKSADYGAVMVAVYMPPGNYPGQYKKNVFNAASVKGGRMMYTVFLVAVTALLTM